MMDRRSFLSILAILAAPLTRDLANAISDNSVTNGGTEAPGSQKPGAQVVALAR